MRIAVCHSGPTWSTADVEAGLVHGLEAHGVEVARWHVDEAIPFRPDAVILVTAIRHELAAIQRLIDAGHCVTALFTESPYEAEKELDVARIVAGCWTHERTAVEAFQAVNPRVSYLPHAWHPGIHTAIPQPGDEAVRAHDVVFVGSGFRERVSFFNAIDWTGIDLGLYGIWDGLGLNDQLQACVRSDGPIANTEAAALYRRAKIGLNLYRRLANNIFGLDRPENWVHAESLNPRAYELAACGCLQVSEKRAEVREVFGEMVPTFRTPQEASVVIRHWLNDPNGWALRAQAQESVRARSWIERAGQVLRDLRAWHLTEAAA